MSDRLAIHFTPVEPGNRRAVLALRVHPDQRRHVGLVADLLADAQTCSGCLPLVIFEGGRAVGFVRIEEDARSVTGSELTPPSAGMRAFFIDARHQGRGLGTRALHALLKQLPALLPHARGVTLSVDATNAQAIALYRRAGFVPLGRGYDGGPSRSARLLWRALPDPRSPCTITSATSSN